MILELIVAFGLMGIALFIGRTALKIVSENEVKGHTSS